MQSLIEQLERITRQPEEFAQTSQENAQRRQQRSAIQTLWQMMGSMYGHKWTTSYGDEVDPDRVWQAALVDVTPEQIKNGLRRCASEGLEWPPSAPEFRKICLNLDKKYEGDWEHKKLAAADKIWDEQRRLPYRTKAERSKTAAAEALSKIREMLGASEDRIDAEDKARGGL